MSRKIICPGVQITGECESSLIKDTLLYNRLYSLPFDQIQLNRARSSRSSPVRSLALSTGFRSLPPGQNFVNHLYQVYNYTQSQLSRTWFPNRMKRKPWLDRPYVYKTNAINDFTSGIRLPLLSSFPDIAPGLKYTSDLAKKYSLKIYKIFRFWRNRILTAGMHSRHLQD